MKVTLREHVDGLVRGEPDRPIVAFFDLDRTLMEGYSLTALAWQQLFNGSMSLKSLITLGWMFIEYGLGRITYGDMLQATVNDIKGMTEEELSALGRQAFAERLAGWMYQEGADLIEGHKAQGHQVVLVTSATRYQAEPVAELLGITQIRCTELEIVDGRVAGGVEPCYGEGKLVAASDYAREVSADLTDAYFYSDSADDLPLLEKVGKPVVVNGKSKLVAVGDGRGWPSLTFSRTGHFSAA